MSLFKAPLSGFNAGGWLAQSDLSPAHLSSFITEQDFRYIAAQGFNTVRLPFGAKLLQTAKGALDPDGLRWLDKAWGWAQGSELNLILDLHQVPGHSFVDPAENNLYVNLPRQRQGQKLWEALAKRFRGADESLGFELLNEAVAPSAAHWQALAEDWGGAIRAVDPERPLIMGSNLWNCAAEFEALKPLPYAKVLYTFHYYEPHHFTHQGAPWVPWAKDLPPQSYPGEPQGLDLSGEDPQALAQAGHLKGRWDRQRLEGLLKPVLDFRQAHQVPVFCGEFGVYLRAGRADQLRWLGDVCRLFTEHGLGFLFWNYRDMDYGLRYTREPWRHLPRYQNPGQRDEDVAALLARTAKALRKGA